MTAQLSSCATLSASARNFAIDAATVERLSAGNRRVSDEIRERLDRTFNEDQLDPVTRELRDIVVDLAKALAVDYRGAWHQSSGCHQAFGSAVAAVIKAHAPKPTTGISALMEPDIPPETLGQIRLRDIQREHSYPHLEAAQRRQQRRLTIPKAKGDNNE